MDGGELKILLVEDNPGDTRLILEMLSEAEGGPFVTECEEMLSRGLQRLAEEQFDVVLLDLTLPDSRGLETVQTALEQTREVPIVVLTGVEDGEAARSVLDLGAQDYLVKGKIAPDSLERSIRYAMVRHRFDEALRESEEQYRLLVENVGEVIVTTDLDLVITYVSPSVQRQTGFTAEDALGRSCREFITDESFEVVSKALEEQLIIQHGNISNPPDPVRLEIEQCRKDGSTYPAELSGGFLRDRGGLPYGVLVVSRDITKQKKSEEEIRNAQQEAVSILMSSADAVLQADTETGIILDCNQSAELLFERSCEDLVGSHQSSLHPSVEKNNYVRVFKDHAGGSPPLEHGGQIITAGGEIKDVTIAPMFLSVGGKVLAFGVFHDISERMRLERDREKMSQELENRVAERTTQLEVAYKELEAFSYSVSHDLRTPLRAIEGFSRILEDEHAGSLDEEGLRLLGIIRQNCTYMAQLIDHLLMLSRVDRREPSEMIVDMCDLVRQVVSELEPSFEGRAIEFDIQEVPPVRGDPMMWHQVWENLLSNAIKFTRNEERATIRIGSVQGDGENVFFIQDNGAGFDMRYADRLFGVFRRLHSADDFEGVGVGLALVQRIVRRHGGRVWAEGELDEGATFYFTSQPVKE